MQIYPIYHNLSNAGLWHGLMAPCSYAFNRTADFDTVRRIKERFCYVACDFPLEKKLAYETCVLEQSYQVKIADFFWDETMFRNKILLQILECKANMCDEDFSPLLMLSNSGGGRGGGVIFTDRENMLTQLLTSRARVWTTKKCVQVFLNHPSVVEASHFQTISRE